MDVMDLQMRNFKKEMSLREEHNKSSNKPSDSAFVTWMLTLLLEWIAKQPSTSTPMYIIVDIKQNLLCGLLYLCFVEQPKLLVDTPMLPVLI